MSVEFSKNETRIFASVFLALGLLVGYVLGHYIYVLGHYIFTPNNFAGTTVSQTREAVIATDDWIETVVDRVGQVTVSGQTIFVIRANNGKNYLFTIITGRDALGQIKIMADVILLRPNDKVNVKASKDGIIEGLRFSSTNP